MLARVLLTTLVFLGLSIQRLIQRIIDRGINQQNQQVVIETSDTDHYAPARRLYERSGYTLAMLLQDFYHDGDGSCTYTKRLR